MYRRTKVKVIKTTDLGDATDRTWPIVQSC